MTKFKFLSRDVYYAAVATIHEPFRVDVFISKLYVLFACNCHKCVTEILYDDWDSQACLSIKTIIYCPLLKRL